MKWLFRATLWLVPTPWRDAVRADLEEEMRASNHDGIAVDVWGTWQVLRLAGPLQWTVNGDALLSDFRYAVRSILRSKRFFAGAVTTFTLGIGVNLAAFAAVDRMLIRRLPYGHPEQLVLLRDCPSTAPECNGAFPAQVAYEAKHHLRTILDVAIAGFSGSYAIGRDPADDPPVALISVSADLLGVLDVRPVLGRDIDAQEVAARQVVAWLSYETWRARFGGRPDVIGRRFWRGSQGATIIGVLPREFFPPAWTAGTPRWDGLVVDYDGWSTVGGTGSVLAPVARLRPGITAGAAQAELDALVQTEWPKWSTRARATPAIRVERLQSSLFSRYRRYLELVVAATGLILIVACGNLAGLIMARSRARTRDAAVRIALGASRGRLLTTAFFEGGLTCAAGGIVALVVLVATSKALSTILPPVLVAHASQIWNPRVLAAGLLLVSVGALVANVLPASLMPRRKGLLELHGSSASDRRTRSGGVLLAVEAAFACVLIVGAILTARSLETLLRDNLGMVPDGLYVVTTSKIGRVDPLQRRTAFQETLDTLRRLPGVVAAGGADAFPSDAPMQGFSGDIQGGRFQITTGYLEALGTKVLAGRLFTSLDIDSGAAVAVISQSGARALWPGAAIESVVGRQWHPDGEQGRTILGVVEDLKRGYGETRGMLVAAYLPVGSEASTRVAVRVEPGTKLDFTLTRTRLQEHGVRLTDITYMRDTLEPYVRDPRFRATLFGLLAATSLLLVVTGLYAIASYEVTERRREDASMFCQALWS